MRGLITKACLFEDHKLELFYREKYHGRKKMKHRYEKKNLRRKVFLKAAFLLIYLGVVFCRGTYAIIIGHDRDDARYRELGQSFKAACHLNLPDGEGALIAPKWVLTVAHAAIAVRKGHLLTIAGREYPVKTVIIHPDWKTSRHDIALIKLKSPVIGVKPIKLYRKRDEAGKIITLIGSGDSGTGLTGPRVNDGTLRGAQNRIDETNNAWIIFKFDEPPDALDLEGISGPGDSGGPALIEENGVLYIAGVSAIQSFAKLGLSEGKYGVLEYYTRISSYIDWIENCMQEN